MAARLRLPGVNVCAGHAVVPARFLRILAEHPRVHVSAACRTAVERLQSRHGLSNASPFSYVTGLSTDLNIYCEPPQFLVEADRVAFEPVAFYGSLATIADAPWRTRGAGAWTGDGPLALYVSFGTQIWDYRETEALAASDAVTEAAASRHELSVLVSLGGKWRSGLDEARLPPNVRVEAYVDQAAALRETDVFLTHHGLNSTHEAIALRVPMLSYPFVWDQPGLAAMCQQLGLAVALAASPMAPITAADVIGALDHVQRSREVMMAALAQASAWEREVVARRPEVVDRIIGLARQRP
jgi:UDP:flavonoid glycosyltransferase YjiC (YdhE family)